MPKYNEKNNGFKYENINILLFRGYECSWYNILQPLVLKSILGDARLKKGWENLS